MLDISRQRELSLHAEVAASVTDCLSQLSIAGIVVGAFARDLHLHYGAGLPMQRGTEDIDFALAVSSWKEFETLRTLLVDAGSFRVTQGMSHRLAHTTGLKIDLVPFGAIESNRRTIAWPPKGDIVMDVFGFQESLTSAEPVMLPNDVHISIVSLPALTLLKIVAWKDRHLRAPLKDAADIYLILRNYLAIGRNKERLLSDFVSWTESPEFDYEHAGARMLGHDIRRLISDHGRLKLATILQTQLRQESIGELSQEMDRRSPDRAHALLQSLHTGLIS